MEDIKRILFITPFAPSEIGAAMKFTKKTIEDLSKKYFVDVVCFRTEGEEDYLPDSPNIRILEEINVNRIRRIYSIVQRPFNFPIFSTRYSWTLAKRLQKYNSRYHYDLLFLDHSQCFIYGTLFPEVKKIMMSHDVIYQRISRQSGSILSKWCYLTERKYLNQINATIFSFSEKDKSLIKDLYGIDSAAIPGNIDSLAIDALPTNIADNYIFFGQWVRQDNLSGLIWFFDEVYPQCLGKTKFTIIGRGLPQQVLDSLQDKTNVEYLGFVDNPYQLIANSKAVLSPLFTGAGVKFKVLEALACGTPVIGTDIAFEGIPPISANFMIKSVSPQEYLNAMNNVGNISVSERKKEKMHFIKEYMNNSIVNQIDNIL